MRESWLVIDTSARTGQVGLVIDGEVVGTKILDPSRRPNRDLVPFCDELLRNHKVKPFDIHAIAVNIGPGSYTGLRVGLISAKMFAFVTGCRVIGVPSFAAIAAMSTAVPARLRIIADGLQGLLYAQDYELKNGMFVPNNMLHISSGNDWWCECFPSDTITGPGLAVLSQDRLNMLKLLPEHEREPTILGMYRASLTIPPWTQEEVANAEPLYLRPSSAEELADRRDAIKS